MTSEITDESERIKAAHTALDKIETTLMRMGELAKLSSDETANDKDRALYQRELTYLKGELDFICNTAEYEGQSLFAQGAQAP